MARSENGLSMKPRIRAKSSNPTISRLEQGMENAIYAAKIYINTHERQKTRKRSFNLLLICQNMGWSELGQSNITPRDQKQGHSPVITCHWWARTWNGQSSGRSSTTQGGSKDTVP